MRNSIPTLRVAMSSIRGRTIPRRLLILGMCLGFVAWTLDLHAADATDVDLEQLMRQDVHRGERMDTTITSVGKRNQKLSETAAAVYVISQEDIRRSGVTSIPDALRMVPGLDVARIDSNKWAISSRGFNSRFANKLLVLMDGREVYSPTFGGVYWEVQDTPLHDIDRIEVIRGPGASLWGANAVNGVINIITKSATDSTGARLTAGTGTFEKSFGSFRYGHQFDENTAGRVWAQGFNRGSFNTVRGDNNRDDWDMARAGFRLDRDAQHGSASTLLGNAYSGTINQQFDQSTFSSPYSRRVRDPSVVSGFNFLGRWKKALSLSSEIDLQAYYDHTYRREVFLSEERDTFDFELQHRLLWGDHQSLNWGMGYRVTQDRYDADTFNLAFRNAKAAKQLFSLFLQDEIELLPNTLTLTLGTKLQYNDFTGFEGQPNLRLLWEPSKEHTFWGSISRALRTPSRADENSQFVTSVLSPSDRFNPTGLPLVAMANGSPRFAAEELLAYELGYRFKPRGDFSVDLALFYNDYQHLRGIDFSQPTIRYPNASRPYYQIDGPASNSMKAQSFGAEWLMNWQAMPWWKMELAYSYIHLSMQSLKGPLNFSAENGVTPQQQFSFRSAFDLGPQVDLDFWLRYVDLLPLNGTITGGSSGVPAYLTLDARLGWRFDQNLELSLVGQNLLENRHTEMQQEIFGSPRSDVPRGVYFKLDWQF